MGGGGGKGGSQSQTSEVRMPKEIEAAAKDNLKIADEVAKIGYVPYSGPTVAAFTPNQMAAMQNTQGAASAFNMGGAGAQAKKSGVDPFTGMAMDPTLTGGVLGYSPKGIYDAAKGQIPEAQRKMIDSFFINPQTGAAPTNPLISGTQLYGGGQGSDGRSQQAQRPGGGAGGKGGGGVKSARYWE
jgi:hypothetical protein